MSDEENIDLALKVPLFKGLSREDVQEICSIMIPRTFNPGEVILHEDDDETQTFFVIIQGSVNVGTITAEGKQIIFAQLNKGEFFGEMALLDGEPRSASVMAAEKCRIFMLYRKPFLEMLHKISKHHHSNARDSFSSPTQIQ